MRQLVNRITCWYIVFYALYSISTRFMPTAIFCQGTLADVLYKSVIIGAGILALFYFLLLAKTRRRPDKSLILLAAFAFLLGISTLLNREYEFTGNILGTATFTAQLIVFYCLARMMPEQMLAGCMRRTALFTSLFWTPGCAISLYQYIANIHYTTLNADFRFIRQGIIDGRLFGLFSDPNFAAFTSLLIILLLVFTLRTWKHKIFVCYGAVCIFINMAYIIMSNSRTIYITAVGTLLFFVLLATYRRHRQEETMDKRLMKRDFVRNTLIALASVAAVYAAIFFSMQGIGYVVAPDRDIDDMVREDVNLENLSNNRTTIWKNYVTLYTDKPLFGFSVRSALPYATSKYPDGYLAKTQYVTHNGYLSLLVETGLTGFLVMGAFFLLTFVQFIKRVRKKEAHSDSYVLFTAITAAVLMFLFCFHDVFFTVNIETMLLFIAIGFINSGQTISKTS